MIGFTFDNATIARDGIEVLRDLTWAARPGETWAVVGGTASGKTTLLEAIQGKLAITAGSRTVSAGTVRTVAFAEASRTFGYGGKYYQQRYEFADSEEPLSVAQFLAAGTLAADTGIRSAADALGIAGQLAQPFLTLSNGQTRRARIAKALLFRPDWLLLDDPFAGIDVGGRAELVELLAGVAKSGCGLILATAPEWVPGWVTAAVELRDGLGRIVSGQTNSLHLSLSGGGWRAEGEPGEGLSCKGEEMTPHSAASQSTSAQQGEVESHCGPSAELPSPILEFADVTVRRGGKLILDGVSWTVRRGERWALTGPNGAGKTTLLALACGDHPQAFSNDVKLFGRRRGSGETVWDVKRNIGFASPEFHLYFREPLTALEAAATAFGDSLLYRPPTEAQAARLNDVFRAFGCEDLASRKFSQLSVGQQRLVLLVRAVAKDAPLLILDEPLSGLDSVTAGRVRDWLDDTLRPDQTLVFVTHHLAHLPRAVTHHLKLRAGRVEESGPAGFASPGEKRVL